MQNDFDKVESELRQIEEDFETGRMNAFGSKSSQDAFIRELRRIADIESQVFYKTCTILKASNRGEHGVMTSMFASAEAPGQGGSLGTPSAGTEGMEGSMSRFRGRSGGIGSARGSLDDPVGSTPFAMPNGSTALPLLRRGSLGAPGRLSLPRPLGQGGKDSTEAGRRASDRSSSGPGGPTTDPGTGTDTRAADSTQGGTSFAASKSSGGAADPLGDGGVPLDMWGNEAGYADSAFDDVVEHFHLLESEFEFVGEHLRQISKHVLRLNDMSDQVNSTNPTNTEEMNALRREAIHKKRGAELGAMAVAASATNRTLDL